VLSTAEINAECGNGEEIGENDDKVDGVNTHEVRRE
jgi:hypothetical protein